MASGINPLHTSLLGMIKAVIFDLDGTLVDATEAICRAVNETIKELTGRNVSCRAIRQEIGHPIWEFFETLSPEIRDRSREASAIYRKKYDIIGKRLTKLLPHVKEKLSELKKNGLKVAVVSQRPVGLTKDILGYTGISEFVDVITSGEETEPKPSPYSVKLAIEILGVKPDETVVVGDGTFDIDAGKAIGARTIGVLTGVGTRKDFEKSGADEVISTMGDLKV